MTPCPEWVFPNVVFERRKAVDAVGVAISAASVDVADPAILNDSEVISLGLDRVPLALQRLPGIRLDPDAKTSWAISPHPRSLHGSSAQLSAALTYLASNAKEQKGVRPPFANVPRIWATGEILDIGDGILHVGSVGGTTSNAAGEAFDRKLEAFLRSEDALFVCTAKDVESAAIVSRPRVVSLDEFVRFTDSESPTRATVVALEEHQLVRFLSVLFPGLFDGFILYAPVVHIEQRSNDAFQLLDEVLRRHERGVRHSEPWDDCGRTAIFASPDHAAAFGVDLFRRSTKFAAAIHLEEIQLNGLKAAGTHVDLVRDWARLAKSGQLLALEPLVRRLSTKPQGHELPSPPLAGPAVFDVSPDRHPYEINVQTPFSPTAARMAKRLTISRAFLGLAAGTAFAFGWFMGGLGLYVIGLLTDVLDGLVARQWNGVTAWGKSWDGIVDMLFNALSTIGFVFGAIFVWADPWAAMWLALGTAVPVAASRPWIPPGSRAAKCRSGLIRCAIIGCALPQLPPGSQVAAAIGLLPFLVVAAVYEVWVMSRDTSNGANKGWFDPPPPSLERPDQKILRAVLRRLHLSIAIGAE